MIITRAKPFSEIVESLEGFKNIFIAGCGSCATACKTGGEEDVAQMKSLLEENGFHVNGTAIIDEACHVLLSKRKIREVKNAVDSCDAVLVMACGSGVRSQFEATGKKCLPALDTLFLGSTERFGHFKKKCAMCGQCMLALTDGICPVAGCTKSLLNGPCGGVRDDGTCEADPEKQCAWIEIYENMKKNKKTENLKKVIPAKDYSKGRTHELKVREA